jgi:hypothetical protein
LNFLKKRLRSSLNYLIPPLLHRPLKHHRNNSTHNHSNNNTSNNNNGNNNAQQQQQSIEWVSMNYIPFGEKALTVAVKLYQQTANDETVIDGQILHEIIKALQIPLALKYKCMSASTWKLAISSLRSVLHTGLPVARRHPKQFAVMWPDLSETLDQFLFPKR